MADRYWVGGSADWDATAGTKWATTSGGSGGAAVPTSSDDVYFDSNSGAATVRIAYGASCKSLNVTSGFTGSVTNAGGLSNRINVYGSITLGANMTGFAPYGLVLYGASGMNYITSNGRSMTIATSVTISGLSSANVTYQLQDDLVINGTSSTTGGGLQVYGSSASTYTATLDMNDHNLTARLLLCSGSYLNALVMGSGTLELTGYGTSISPLTIFEANASKTTITCETSTIKVSGSASYGKTFAGAGKVYNNLQLTGGTGYLTITGGNTFNKIQVDVGSSTKQIRFAAGSTQTITDLDMVGTSSYAITLRSSSSGSTWTVSKSSGTTNVYYCTITDSTATGGATFNCYAGTDGGNNAGWNFLSLTHVKKLLGCSYASLKKVSGITVSNCKKIIGE
jgi:hypothetical protein